MEIDPIMAPFHITQAILDQFAGCQIAIRQYGKSPACYYGAIKTVILDAEGMLFLQLSWFARADDPLSINPVWTKENRAIFEADLLFYRPSLSGDGILCLTCEHEEQTIIFYPRDNKRQIDPAIIKACSHSLQKV